MIAHIVITVLLVSALSVYSAKATLEEMSLPQLEQRRAAIDEELKQLANFSLRGEAGSNGYRSSATTNAHRSEWVEVDLGEEISIDEIVLAPTLSRTKTGIKSDGFPIAFRILAGTSNDQEGSVIATFTEEDKLLPRIAPLVVPVSGTVASWVRIEATQLSSRNHDGRFVLQFSELLVFGGEKNHALRRPVKAPNPDKYPISAWGKRFLTDGAIPYLMDSATGETSNAYISGIGLADKPALTIDLQGIHSVSGISLHLIDQSDTIPQSSAGDVGVPLHMQVEGATNPDFSDAFVMLNARRKTFHDISPIMSWDFVSATPCRYVRLTALEPYIYDNGQLSGTRIGFAEIELFAANRNMALGKPVSSNFADATGGRSLSALTDGCNFYGTILPIREWMHQLTRRHDLEKERPLVVAELQRRYTQQEINLTRMYWLAALLAAAIILTILIDRMFRMRQVARIRARFAADLHDELGADLHTIGLLSDLASEARDNPKKLDNLLHQIRITTEETGASVRHCTKMQEANLVGAGLPADLRRVAERIVVDLDHKFTVDGEEFLTRLRPRIQSDLFLFYKECLINICRHAGADQFSTHLAVTPKQICLTIADNGIGLEEVPSSLKRRARLLRARVTAERSESGGTKITLTLRNRT